MLKHHGREAAVAAATLILAAGLGLIAPDFFTAGNFRDLFLANLPVLIIALGMTLLIVTGEIDISIGSAFAVCGVAAGTLAKLQLPIPVVVVVTCACGALLGAVNGWLTARVQVPSIVVTLAMMIGLRDALRWVTEGTWVQDLPAHFQWLGFSQRTYPIVTAAIAMLLMIGFEWASRNIAVVRALYATGSNTLAARLAGIDTGRMKLGAFVSVGALTGLAALLNSARFNQIPINAGLGLEMKVIAAVVIGGASIAGGRGTVPGTVLGVMLLAAIGPALTYLGVSAYWERAAQGGIILLAVSLDAVGSYARDYASHAAPAQA